MVNGACCQYQRRRLLAQSTVDPLPWKRNPWCPTQFISQPQNILVATYRLIEKIGPDPGRKIELTAGQYTMGRHPDCDIVLNVAAVSRHHAEMVIDGNKVFLRDLGSRNGTYLNGQMIHGRQPLSPRDEIRICDIILELQSDLETLDSPFIEGPSTTEEPARGVTLLVNDDEMSSNIRSKLRINPSEDLSTLEASSEARLNALLEITSNLGGTLSLDEVLPKVLDSLFKIFAQADRGFIVLKSDPDGYLIPRWTKLRDGNKEDTIRISRTIIDEVIQSREAVLSADAASDERFLSSHSIAAFHIRSMMCAPLVNSQGLVLGVLQIDTLGKYGRFENKDLEVLLSVATQAAVAIENARLHENLLQQRELERDLELAHSVQLSFLPDRSPEIIGYGFFGYYEAANQVGGDYYDYIQLSDGRIAIIVADVVGHGVAAALLMARLAAEVRVMLATEPDPTAAFIRLNELLVRDGVPDRFVTSVMTVLEPDRHKITIVNAGHMPPLIRRLDGTLEEPGETQVGIPLGIIDGFQYESFTVELRVGDRCTLYTDGINEAMDPCGQLFGIDRVKHHVQSKQEGVVELGQQIINDVRQFMGNQSQSDDMCLVCFGRLQ